MRQIKLFEGSEDSLSSLESEVNGWLAEQADDIEVRRITGNIAPQTTMTDTSGAGGATTLATSKGKRRFAASDVLIIVEFDVDG